MALPLWGSLEKSTDDSETIEEAIARLIVAHEEDPEAHLGVGESLEQHKSEEVIDHPPGSILPDKRSARDLEWNFSFVSTDGFDTTGDVSVSDFKLGLYVEDGAVNSSSIFGTPISQAQYSDLESSVLLEVSCFFLNGGSNTAEVSFGGLYFEIENDRVRGKADMTGMSSPVFTSWYNVDMTKLHVLRANYFVLEGVVRFYVDGDMFESVNATYTPASDDVYFNATHTRNTASDDFFYLSKLIFSLYEFQ